MTETSQPEFTRVIDIRHIEAKPLELVASREECAAMAQRFALVAIHGFAANLTLSRDGSVVTAKGRLTAAIVQSCAVSAEDLPATIDEPLTLRFVPDSQVPNAPDEEVELNDADCDEIPYSGERIDLGEALAQSLALAIDPFAIGPEAETVRHSGLLGQESTSPFAALAALKKDQ